MGAPKINVKEHVTDGEIDLSMLDLQEVPFKEIVSVKKAYSLDLSNNHLSTLPKSFPTLTALIKIDLSKNKLKELPENFGDLVKLKHLDLYKNQLQHLPLSFSKLTSLKWLDLKDNPLVPSIAEVAGHCLDAKQCQQCARDIVNLYAQLQVTVDEERKSREEQRQRSLEENAAKLKQEKKSKKSKLAAKKQPEVVADEVKLLEDKFDKLKMEGKPEKTKVKSCASASFISFVFKLLSVLLVLFGICMIALTVAKAKFDLPVEDIRKFVLGLDIPIQLKECLIIIGEYLLFAQDTISIKAVELLGAHNVDIVLNAFTGLYKNVTQAGTDFYLKIFAK